MKKIIAFLIVPLTFSFGAIPENKFQNINAEKEFDKISKIENYINSHQGTTHDDLMRSNSELLSGIQLSNYLQLSLDSSDPLGNIPPFWWGFCCSIVGFIVVIVLSDSDKDATKKALTGCLISGGIGCIAYIGIYVWVLGYSSAWTFY